MRISERASILSLDQAIVPDKLDFGPSRRMALGQAIVPDKLDFGPSRRMALGQEPPKEEGFFTWKNILLIGGIALVGYFILQHLAGEE